jgi:hypothetical protein
MWCRVVLGCIAGSVHIEGIETTESHLNLGFFSIYLCVKSRGITWTFLFKGQCYGSTAHPKYARTWKTVPTINQVRSEIRYTTVFIIPSLCRTSLLCFKNWRLLHLFQSCSINFKCFFAPFILTNHAAPWHCPFKPTQ